MFKALEFDWDQAPAVALNPNIYRDFLPRIQIDNETFYYDRSDKDADHWITAIYYRSDDGREIVALKGT
jgi:hypothetical protein